MMELKQINEKEVFSRAIGTSNYAATESNTIEAENSNGTDSTYTVSDAIEHMGFGKFHWKLLIMLSSCVISDGVELMALSIIGPLMQCQWYLSQIQMALITTAVFLGMISSTLFVGTICDTYGRRKGLLLFLSWGFFSAMLSAFSPSYVWIIILRFLVGTSIPSLGQVPVFAQEFLPKSKRHYCLLMEMAWTIGALLAASSGLILLNLLHLHWKWYLLTLAVPMFISTFFVFLNPKSARYLAAKSQINQAQDVLTKISKENNIPLPKGKLTAIKSKPAKVRFIRLFQDEYRNSTLILMFIFFVVGFSYYGIILLTTQYFHSRADSCLRSRNLIGFGFSNCVSCKTLSHQNYMELIWTTFAETPGVLVTFYLFEKIGRKKTLALDFLVAFLCICPLYFCINRTAAVISISIVRACLFGAFCGLQGVYGPEVYPTSFRATSVSLLNGASRLGGMTTPFFSQVSIQSSLTGTVSVYAILLVTSAFLCLWLPIETKGRQLDKVAD